MGILFIIEYGKNNSPILKGLAYWMPCILYIAKSLEMDIKLGSILSFKGFSTAMGMMLGSWICL